MELFRKNPGTMNELGMMQLTLYLSGMKAPTIDDELKSCKIILKAATIDDESKSCKIMLKGGGEARSVKWSHEQTSIDLLDIIIDPAGLWRSARGRKWTALS